MSLSRTLELRFKNEADRTVTVRVADPREDLTAGEIKAAMEAILAADVFSSTGGDLVGLVDARLVSREVTTYDLGV